MRVDKRAHEVSMLQSELELMILKFQSEHDLTDVETLQALTNCQASKLRYMLRYERHGNYDTPAMESKEEE